MRITIASVGKLKEKYFRQAVDEYAKRLSRYCKLDIQEVADEKTPDGASETVEEQIRLKEGRKLLALMSEGAYVIALAIDGKTMDSLAMAGCIEDLTIYGKSHIIFVIGGSLGLSKEVLQRADMKLSFSKLTFPHQLMRVILLEQIYRSFRIINREPYHK